MRFALVSPLPLVLALLLGCEVMEEPLPPSAIAVNACEEDADCKLSYCKNGACAAPDTMLTRLLVQVTPPATLPGLGGFAFYRVLEGQSPTGGRLNIDLGQIVHVEGHVDIAEDDTCVPAYAIQPAPGSAPGLGRTIPVDVSFTPSERFLGIASSVYTTTAKEASADGHFSIEIPPGKYDVYIKPLKLPGSDDPCAKPPRLLPGQLVAGGLAVNLRPPSKLPVNVYWPHELPGWKVALLDEPTGRVISTEPVLAPIDDTDSAFHYTTELSYFDVTAPEEMAEGDTESPEPDRVKILRLTPPAGEPYPSVFLELFTGEIVQKTPLPGNVTVSGQTAIEGRAVPVEAMLKLTAQSLEGFDSGIFATYAHTLSVPKSGLFEIPLPPGRYKVEATPAGSSAGCPESGATEVSPCLASAATIWEVGAQPAYQAGRLLEFPTAKLVSGRATLWLGGFPTGATVHATASLADSESNLINARLGATEPIPRATSALVRADGTFTFSPDPGLYDLVVQPDPSTRFGWYAWSSIKLPELDPIGVITVQPPVVYSGGISVVTNVELGTRVAVPGALVRAYADTDGEEGGAVVQVAEAWADDEGNFSLLIPQQFGPAPNRSNDYNDAPRPDMR